MEEQALHDLPPDGRPNEITPLQRERALQMGQAPLAWTNCPSPRPGKLYPFRPTWQFRNTIVPDSAARLDYVANFGDTEPKFIAGPSSLAAAAAGVGFDPYVTMGLVFAGSEIRLRQIPDGMSKTYMIGEKSLAWGDWEGGVPAGPSRIGLHPMAQGWVATAYWRPEQDRPGFEPEFLVYGSLHPGGWPVAMADGSVHTMDYEIDLAVHRAGANRADGG